MVSDASDEEIDVETDIKISKNLSQ